MYATPQTPTNRATSSSLVLNKHGQLKQPVLNLRGQFCEAEKCIGMRVCVANNKLKELRPKGAFTLEIPADGG